MTRIPQKRKNLATYSPPPNKKIKPMIYVPDDVVDRILTFLPYKKLCSLSILSKRFQNTWKRCRDLSFDVDFARNLSRDEVRSIVDNFFNNNNSTQEANRLKLHYDATDESNLVSFWVGKAIRLGINELELALTQTEEKVTLNYDLVDVETLKILKLNNCDLYLPLKSNGLRHLREMTLQNVMTPPVITDSIFHNCVSLRVLRMIRCSLVYSIKAWALSLESLVVKDCFDVHLIEVTCPLLRRLHYHGKMTELRFLCEMKCLRDVILGIAHPRSFQRISRRDELVAGLANVEVLTVTSIFLEGLCAKFENNAYKKMEFLLPHLKELHLIVASESFVNPSDIVIFVKRCPILENFYVDLGRDALSSSLYWVNYGHTYLAGLQTTFPSIKQMKIKGFTKRELPVYLARYFLKNAINLTDLVLVKARVHHHFPLDYNPENFRWGIISTARIDLLNCRADKHTIMPQHLMMGNV